MDSLPKYSALYQADPRQQNVESKEEAQLMKTCFTKPAVADRPLAIVFAHEKTGSSHFCINCPRLNIVMVCNSYAIPPTGKLIESI